MTKRKTALQSAIDEIAEVLNSRGANESNCDDYELGLIKSVKILKSKLPQEEQDLIDFGDKCYYIPFIDEFGDENTITVEQVLKQTFGI